MKRASHVRLWETRISRKNAFFKWESSTGMSGSETQRNEWTANDANNSVIDEAGEWQLGHATPTVKTGRHVTRQQARHATVAPTDAKAAVTENNASDDTGLGLSMPSVIGTALAAVTATVLSTQIGIAGSLIGTVVASIVSNVASKVYARMMSASIDAITSKAQEHLGQQGDSDDKENSTTVGLASDAEGNMSDTMKMPRIDEIGESPQANGGRKGREEHGSSSLTGMLHGIAHDKKAMAIIVAISAALVSMAVVAVVINTTTNGEGIGTKPTYTYTAPTVNSVAEDDSNVNNANQAYGAIPRNGEGLHPDNVNAENANRNEENANRNTTNADAENSSMNVTSTESTNTDSGTGTSSNAGNASTSGNKETNNASTGNGGTSSSGNASSTNGSSTSNAGNGSSSGGNAMSGSSNAGNGTSSSSNSANGSSASQGSTNSGAEKSDSVTTHGSNGGNGATESAQD